MYDRVKWECFLSYSFVFRQGVRQSGNLSAIHYKIYNNSLLIETEVHREEDWDSEDPSCYMC